MTRIPREHSAADIYHVIQRGTNKQPIFLDDADRRHFLRLLKSGLGEAGGKAYAWVLMGNHVHLLVQLPLAGLAPFCQRLFSSYALYFNKRHERVGVLFQGRYKSIPIRDDAQFLVALRYVHQNPCRAGISSNCAYRWSSYREYTEQPWVVDCSLALGMLDGLPSFVRFHGEDDGGRYKETLNDSRASREGRASREAKARELHNSGQSLREIESATGISRSTLSRMFNNQR